MNKSFGAWFLLLLLLFIPCAVALFWSLNRSDSPSVLSADFKDTAESGRSLMEGINILVVEPPTEAAARTPINGVARRNLSFLETGDASPYYVDQSAVYCGTTIIPGADPTTFQALSYTPAAGGNDAEWAKDKSHVYYFCELSPEIDAATFVTVFRGVMKDKNKVYFLGIVGGRCGRNPLCDADAQTFVSIGYYFFKDRNRAFNLEKWGNLNRSDLFKDIPVDIPSLIAIDEDHMIDKKNVYRIGLDPSNGYFLSIDPNI